RAGHACGWPAGGGHPRSPTDRPEPPPLIPTVPDGAGPDCTGPAHDRFTHSGLPGSDSFLWSSVATVPGSGDAIAGGQIRPADDGTPTTRNGDRSPEPVLAQVTCEGRVTVTRFTTAGQTAPGNPILPADRQGRVEAVAANATNDAWAATSAGDLTLADPALPHQAQPPRLYHFTDGTPPRAQAGDDVETRPLQLKQDPPIIV